MFMQKDNTKNSFLNNIMQFLKTLPPLTWVVVVLALFFGIVSPEFFDLSNLANVLRRGSALWIIATMATMVMKAGGLDLSLGSVITFSGVVLALLLQSGWNAGMAIMGSVLAGTAIGFINGYFVSFPRLPAFIVTLGTMNIFAGLSVALTETKAIFIDNPIMVFIGAGAIAGIPVPILVAVLIFIVSFIIMRHTSFGRNLIAIGENESGAHLSGVNTKLNTLAIYIYSSTMAAIAGLVLASRIQSADPTVGVGWEFDAIAATIMGGTLQGKGSGNIATTIVGTLLIIILRNGLNIIGVPVEWRTAIVGLFLLTGIIFDISIRRRDSQLA
jgi:ribose transport system permease protein